MLLKFPMTLKTQLLQWPHSTLKRKSFNDKTASLQRVNLARRSQSHPNGKYRISKSAWQAMSEEERQDALKVMRAFNENRDSSSFSRGRGGRGRGNSTAQRPKTDKSEAKADIAEITSGGVSCFNAAITGKIFLPVDIR